MKMNNMGRRLTNEQFIEKSNEIHNNKYDYSLSCYKNKNNDIKLIRIKYSRKLKDSDILEKIHIYE